jgi:hypothetical protein
MDDNHIQDRNQWMASVDMVTNLWLYKLTELYRGFATGGFKKGLSSM